MFLFELILIIWRFARIELTCFLLIYGKKDVFLQNDLWHFRFGDLNESMGTKLTEYVLLGTLPYMVVAICGIFIWAFIVSNC